MDNSWIAATAIAHDRAVASQDSYDDAGPGLRVMRVEVSILQRADGKGREQCR